MKRFLPLIVLFIICLDGIAQKPDQIKSDSRYICGEATALSLDKADSFAIKDLVSQISTKVESSFSTTMIESGENLEEYTHSAISTYSNIYLNDAKRIVVKKRKKVYVLRYVERDVISGIFENRKSKIMDYTNLAVLAEQNYRIADALRYYYWALALLNSHPQKFSIKYKLDNGYEISLLTFINNEIDKIFQSLNFSVSKTVSKTEKDCFILEISYKNKPVTNLDYVFWTGNTWSGLYSAKDGIGLIEFFNHQSDMFSQLRVKIEYQYLNRTKIDQEVESVMDMASLPRLKSGEITIPLGDEQAVLNKDIESEVQLESVGFFHTSNIKDSIDDTNKALDEKIYQKSITQINQAIISNYHDNINNLFTENGLKCYDKIIKYGNAELLPKRDSLKYISINNQTMVRSFPMSFKFPNNNRTFIEDIVYVFDSTGKVDNISFALSDIALNDIINKSNRFGTEEEKYFLINFLENYKTAYALENLEYIESVFADNALIIVGTKLIDAEPIDGMYKQLDNQNIIYTRYSKDEYLTHLEKAFNSKEYINIAFENTEIRKTGGEDKIYGIQLAQNYYSSNYSDKGYLFLMIDLNDTINPKIYVRTWQPEKNSDGSTIGLENFTIK